jgi:hypothetical protein
MLTFFCPWHTGKDLKKKTKTWDDAFTKNPFNDFQQEIMNNFNICYECLDARDDYRAQMEKGSALSFGSSWKDLDNNDDNDFAPDIQKNQEAVNDDIPVNLLKTGKAQYNRLMQMQMINHVLRNTG